jgi:alpha-1,3-rhamnosyl/mannosyltransferase
VLSVTSNDKVTVVTMPPMAAAKRLVWEQVAFPRLVRASRVEVLHSPHYTMPVMAGCKTVVTIHDLTFFLMPEVHTRPKRVFFRWMTRLAARKADALIVDSESTGRDLARIAPVATVGGRLHVAPLGVGPPFTLAGDERETAETLTTLNLVPGRYVLSVGLKEPRKNLARLLSAFAELPRDLHEFKLVLAGGQGWLREDLTALARERQVAERVMVLDHVPTVTLDALYRGASVFVYPSLYEGFGLPVLEAMAAGAPVVTSNLSAMPEVLGDTGILVDPLSTRAISGAIESFLRSADRRVECGRRAAARASSFSWQATAEKTARVYRWVAPQAGRDKVQ